MCHRHIAYQLKPDQLILSLHQKAFKQRRSAAGINPALQDTTAIKPAIAATQPDFFNAAGVHGLQSKIELYVFVSIIHNADLIRSEAYVQTTFTG